ncbi:hypothetical protein LJR153_007254 [Paenibacillus sp. LjRoot153]
MQKYQQAYTLKKEKLKNKLIILYLIIFLIIPVAYHLLSGGFEVNKMQYNDRDRQPEGCQIFRIANEVNLLFEMSVQQKFVLLLKGDNTYGYYSQSK